MITSKFIIIFIIFLIIFAHRFYTFFDEKTVYLGGENVVISTTLQETPSVSNMGQQFRIKTESNQYIYVNTEAFPQYHFGQVLRLEGEIEAIEKQDHTIYVLRYPQIIVKKEAANPLVGAAAIWRNQTKALYERSLPPVSASLLMGIVFGSREQFPDDFWEALQVTGVMHVIAASGMNVTFVSAALLYTLGSFLRRQVALVFGMCGIIFYLFLVGFEPSILRASLMGILAFSASLLGRQHLAIYAVLVSAYAMLLCQPSFLFDVGFQLSFTATLGILFFKPLLDAVWPKYFAKWGRDTITTTLAAQIGTLPILLSVFGQIGIISLFVNALVLWTVPIIMFFGALSAILGLFFPFLGEIILYGSLPFLLLFEFIVQILGNKDWVFVMPSWHWSLSAGYYCLLATVLFIIKPKQKPLSLEESLALEKY